MTDKEQKTATKNVAEYWKDKDETTYRLLRRIDNAFGTPKIPPAK